MANNPKCTGSMPISWTIGKKIGVKIRIAGPTSIKQPMIKKTILIISKVMNGDVETPNTKLLTASGIPFKAMANDINEDVANNNIIVPDVSTVWRNIFGKSFTLIVL